MKTRDEIRVEALEVVRYFKRAGAAISMGVGKTSLGFDHFQLVVKFALENHDRKAKGLVVAPTIKILKGWAAQAKLWGYEHLMEDLTFVTYRSLKKQDLDYDVVYLDECHSLTMAHLPWLNSYKGFILGLTGTAPKAGSSKANLVNMYCPIKYVYETDEAIGDGILNDYTITVHLMSLGTVKDFKIEVKKKKKVIKSWYTSEQENYHYWQSKIEEQPGGMGKILQMKAMQTYLSKERYAKQLLTESKVKTLLFANEKKQADRLCNFSYHSGNSDSEENMDMFNLGKINKLSCVLQLSEGANMLGLRRLIIMHSYGNEKKAAQRIGRGLRLNPDEVAHMDILCFKNTKDVNWVKAALENFDSSKITWYDSEAF